MRVARTLPDPKDPLSIVEWVARLQRVVDGGIEFGSPQDPTDPQSTVRANGVAHNGTLQNLVGAWFETSLTAAAPTIVTVTCIHNLNVSTLAPATTPNVRWLLFGLAHDGTGGGAGASLEVSIWYEGGTRTADAIDLKMRANAAGGLTVNGSHPVGVSLYFIPATR